MNKTYAAKDWETAKRDYHIENPQPGDFWTACFDAPVLVILAVNPRFVIAYRRGTMNDHLWEWDTDKPEFICRDSLGGLLCHSKLSDSRMFEEVHRWHEGNKAEAPVRRTTTVYMVELENKPIFACYDADTRTQWLLTQTTDIQVRCKCTVSEIDMSAFAVNVWRNFNALQKLVLLDTSCVLWDPRFVDTGPCYAVADTGVIKCQSSSEQ